MENTKEKLIIDDEFNISRGSVMSISEIWEEDSFRSSLSGNEFNGKTTDYKLFANQLSVSFSSKLLFKKSDFEIIETIGTGSYSKVVKAKLIKDNSLYAIKILNKSFMIKVNFSNYRKINFIKSIKKMRF